MRLCYMTGAEIVVSLTSLHVYMSQRLCGVIYSRDQSFYTNGKKIKIYIYRYMFTQTKIPFHL